MRRLRRAAGLTAAVLATAGCGRTVSHTAAPEPAVPTVAQGPSFPAEPPPPLPIAPVAFPPVYERILANGAQVIVVPNHEQPVVSVSLNIRNGSAADPRGKPGVAAFTADLLTKGTATRSAKEIAETIDFIGGQLSASASSDGTGITTTVLTEFLDTGLELLADVVTHPAFSEEELERYRTRMLSTLELEVGNPEALAERWFKTAVYGAHPYGTSMTPEAVQSIVRTDVVNFHRSFYRPSNALFVVTGDVEPDPIVARLERAFLGWTAGDSLAARIPTSLVSPSPTKRRLIFVHRPGAKQAVYRIGHLMPPARNDDWVGISIMSQILGGGSGWLQKLLREQKGYTYGAYSLSEERQQDGNFKIRTEVRTEVADSALRDMLLLLERIRTEPVPVADLAAARSSRANSFPMTIETPAQVANQVATTLLLGRPTTYLETFRTRVAAMTPADVERVARAHLHPDRVAIVVVGDAGQLLEKLRPFADLVELFDERGRPLAIESLALPRPR